MKYAPTRGSTSRCCPQKVANFKSTNLFSRCLGAMTDSIYDCRGRNIHIFSGENLLSITFDSKRCHANETQIYQSEKSGEYTHYESVLYSSSLIWNYSSI